VSEVQDQNQNQEQGKLMETHSIFQGDCLELMQEIPADSVDAIVTDPPYGISFMGKKWDYDVPKVDVWKEALRVLKPGAFLLCFAGTRTYHRMVVNIEDAGFEIRDMIAWIYGSGFPKSLDISKAIDKANGRKRQDFVALGNYIKQKRLSIKLAQSEVSKMFPSKTGGLTGCVSNWELGANVPTAEQWVILKDKLDLDGEFDYVIEREEAEREVIIRKRVVRNSESWGSGSSGMLGIGEQNFDKTLPATKQADIWSGWGTGLKPALEPIVVARKPLSEGSVASNVLRWGTGGINIDQSRIGNEPVPFQGSSSGNGFSGEWSKENYHNKREYSSRGRFPANLILDEEAGRVLDKQSGDVLGSHEQKETQSTNDWFGGGRMDNSLAYSDSGGASRFFYCAKASKEERNMACSGVDSKQQDLIRKGGNPGGDNPRNRGVHKRPNFHPTVKPLALMEYLIKLVSKEDALVLDPFLGSGTTAIAAFRLNRRFLGYEISEEYLNIANQRLRFYKLQKKIHDFPDKPNQEVKVNGK